MKFGKFLLNSQVPEWGRNYLAYKPLKQQIAGVAQQQKVHLDPSHQQQHGDADAASKDLVTSFFFQLDRELEKVNSFFLFKAAELERRVRILGDTFRVATAPSFADQVVCRVDG